MTERRDARGGPPSPHRTIEPLFERPPSARDTRFQRRRLGLLVGLFLSVAALAPVVTNITSDDGEGDVVAAYASEPVTLSGVIAETSSTLHAATSTAPPSTTVPPTTEAPTTTAPPTTAAPTTEAPTTTAPPTTAAPTTAAPTTAAPTTTAPPPPPTTTAPPPPTTAKPDLPYSDPRTTQVWHDLAQCESDGDWEINTGNGYYGGLQFSLGSWRAVGGTGYPHEHSAATQIEMGRRLQAAQGWGAWPHCSSQLGLR